jgi:hypothetical protein
LNKERKRKRGYLNKEKKRKRNGIEYGELRVEIQKWLKNTLPYALCPLPKAL